MAEFKRNFETSKSEEFSGMEGDSMMSDGTNLGTGFVGGLLVGGLAGWAFNRYDRHDGYGHPPFVENMGYSQADVSNLIATKDAQYAQLNATQESEFNVLSQLYKDNTTLSGAICNLGYENAMLSSTVQRQISDASAKADLCCCKTQGLIAQESAKTQGMINSIVPQIQNFYLADEVEKLRIKSVKSENAYQYGALASQLNCVGKVVEEIYSKVNTPATTTA